MSYDESHGEAWSNIASSYMQLSKPKEAQSSLEHAAKVWRSNWKIWENLIMLYLDGNQFMRVVSSIKQLIRLNKLNYLIYSIVKYKIRKKYVWILKSRNF